MAPQLSIFRVISIKFHLCIQLTFLNPSEVSGTMQGTGDTNMSEMKCLFPTSLESREDNKLQYNGPSAQQSREQRGTGARSTGPLILAGKLGKALHVWLCMMNETSQNPSMISMSVTYIKLDISDLNLL